MLVAPPRAPYVGSPPLRAPFFLADLVMDSAPPPVAFQRRRFLTRLSVALSAAVGAVMGLPVVGFLVAPLTRKEPRVWRPVGRVDEFKVGETVSVRFEDASPLPWAPDQLTTRITNGSPNMPAYVRVLTPEETRALVAFLTARR